jgi:hypothetical protein
VSEYTEPWIPNISPDDAIDPVENAIYQAIGTGSMCWTPRPSGVFDDAKARWTAEGLIAFIKERLEPK